MEFSQLFGIVATSAVTPEILAKVAGLCLLAYLLGSISSAILVCRLLGYPDPRGEGSGNPGATNVLRVAGKPAALVTLAGDVLKGVIAVLVGRWAGVDEPALAWIGFFAFLGHLYPVFFGFDGGKGVATALGVLNTLAWPAGVTVMITWLVVFLPFRISSLAAIVSWALAPVAVWLLAPQYIGAMVPLSLLLLWRHKQNIQDLLTGRERNFRKKA